MQMQADRTAITEMTEMTTGVVVNEVRVSAVHGGAHWLAQWLMRRTHNTARLTIAGGILWLPCEDLDHARYTVDLLLRHMVPRTAMRAASLDTDRAIPLSALRAIGCAKIAGALPLDPQGWYR